MIGVFFFLAVLVFSVLSGIAVIGLLFGVLLIGFVLVATAASMANGAGRLHDRGKSAWWLLVFVGVPMVLSTFAKLMSLDKSEEAAGAAGLVGLISLGFSIWALVELGILKGTEGPNRFGEDPLGPPPAETFA